MIRAPRRALVAGLLGLASCQATAADQPIATPLEPFTTPEDCPLEALGGLRIHRDRLGFGGLSGLVIDDDLRLTAVSDLGRWMQARLVLGADAAPLGLAEVTSGPLLGGGGQPLTGVQQRDAESLARLPDGRFLVGFEHWHRIRIFPDLHQPGAFVPGPPGLEAAPRNGGLEALTVLADGRWFAIAEKLWDGPTPERRAAWLRERDGQWRRATYQPAPGFDPTDACGLADGGALVLERAFSWFGGFEGRLVRVPPAALAGPAIAGEEILRFEPPLPLDNWEAVATFRGAGRDCVAILSDDNERSLQRSLLLVLAWRRR